MILNFAIFDDSAFEQGFAKKWIETLGHKVGAEAKSITEAEALLEMYAVGKLALDAILQDGNGLGQKQGGFAKEVLAHVAELKIDIPIIGYGEIPLKELDIDPDLLFADPTKKLFTTKELYEPLIQDLIDYKNQT